MPERVALLQAFRMRCEVSGNPMIHARVHRERYIELTEYDRVCKAIRHRFPVHRPYPSGQVRSFRKRDFHAALSGCF